MQKKSKSTAVVLAFFLGGLGAHKFYMGHNGWGVVYLLFCWTFIPALIAIIDVIVLLCMSQEAFEKSCTYDGRVEFKLGTISPSEELGRLGALHQKGLLSIEEFNEKKATLLKKIS